MNDWVEGNKQKMEYIYDTNGKIISSDFFNWSGEVWEQEREYLYYYQEVSSNVKKIQPKLPLLIYPNPVVESVTITGVQGATIIIYDLHGRTVHTQKAATDEVQITASAWASGVYVVRVIGDDGSVRSAKLIKK